MDKKVLGSAIVDLVTKIVSSYVRHHNLAPDELARLIASVHQALREVGQPGETAEGRPPSPAVPIRRSVQREYVVCLECGFRRHLREAHGLTPQKYRARWGLPREHPIVAPAYSERRAAMAKQIGLGRGGRRR